MRLFIRCNAEGTIVSAMKVNVMTEALEHPYGLLEEGESVIEVDFTAELEALDCHEICEQFSVDLNQKALEKKPRHPPGAQSDR
jgi:hypothetical protein